MKLAVSSYQLSFGGWQLPVIPSGVEESYSNDPVIPSGVEESH